MTVYNHTLAHKLNAILETSKLLNTTHDVDYILKALLDTSLELIDGGDTGVIFLYNPSSGYLEVEAYAGFTEAITHVKLSPGESMTGAAFVNERPMFFENASVVNSYIATMTEDNLQSLEWSSSKGLHKLQGSIACPLIYQKECIGTIVIDNFENHAALIPEDVQILESISVQATIAIINARNLKMERTHKAELENYNKMLEEERNKYKYSTTLHNRFTDLVLTGCTLRDIITELSTLIGCDVLLIDLFTNVTVFDFHATDYTNMTQDMSEVLNLLRTQIKLDLNVLSTTQCYHALLGKYLNYFPIRVNDETMGWLCILSLTNTFNELDLISIEKGSTILALELLKMNELNDMEQAFKGDFLDALLLNHDKAYLQKCAHDFSFNFNKVHCIIAIGSDALVRHQQDDKYWRNQKRYSHHYYELLNAKLSNEYPGSIAMIKDQEIYAILELKSEDARQTLSTFFEHFLFETDQMLSKKSKMTPLYIGVSQVVLQLDEFNSAFRNAQHALKTLKQLMPLKRYLFFTDLEVKQLLINNRTEVLDAFIDKTLRPLLTYDNRSRDEFLETLQVYMKSNGNWTYTKDHLHIHGNTLNYRLTRIMTLLKADLSDYYQRLNIQIALEILEIQQLHL